MATTKDSGQPTKDKELESLRIKLQQIAAFANKNTEQFESQKKQFFEHFSQVFGTPTNNRNAANNATNATNSKNKSNPNSTTPPKSTTPKVLSPSIGSPNNNNRTPASSIPNINATPTRFDIRPLIVKQNSFSAKSDSNGGNGSVSNPNPNLLNGLLVVNNTNTLNTNLTAINTANNVNKATPISLPLNLTPLQNVATNPSSVFSPGATNMLGNIPQLSVPLSMVSNGSHASSAVYQYPYITDPNSIIPPTPNLGAAVQQTTLNTLPTLNALNTASLSSQYIANKTPATSAQPNMTTTLTSNYSNTSNTSTSSYESFWIRRVLSNILLLFFRYHPNGVLECELSQFYQQMFHEPLQLNSDLKYLLCVHKSIEITRTKERGQLFTLKDDQICEFLQEFDSRILQQWIIKHIRRLFRCFPNGIATNCLQDLLYNMVEFKLDDIIPKWHEFVCNIPTMYCININGLNIFICIELDTLNQKYKKLNQNNNTPNNNIITSNNIQYYLSNHLNQKNILKRPVGYCELLIVLLSNYYSMDPNNMYYKGIDGETLEKAFHQQYQSRLVHEAPFIQDVLSKICNVTVVSKGNDQTKLYKLNISSKQYFETQPDAFAPILSRSLELINNNNNNNNGALSGLPPPKTPHNINIQQNRQQRPSVPQRQQQQQPQIQQPQPPQNNNNANDNDADNGEVIQSPFKEDHVSVFMGGFSHGTTVEVLRAHLAKLGITMISSSGISYRNYGWSFVTLSNAKEAQYLVSISPIQIMGRPIDIRPFINRQRVRNHISNKPSDDAMLNAMIELLSNRPQGLTVADIQLRLFNKFSYRIDGPELTKIVGDNPKHLYIKRQGTERIFATPKLANGITMDELNMKVSKLWKHIACNYRGNIYGVGGWNNNEPNDDMKAEEANEVDKNTDVDQLRLSLSESVNSSAKSSQKSVRTKRKTANNKYRKVVNSPNSSMINSPTSPRSPTSPLSPGSSQNGMPSLREDYTISVNDFENEFARRYRFAVKPENFGFNSTKELLSALKSQQNLPFKVIEYEFPPQPPQNYFMQQQQGQNGYNNNNNMNNNNYRDRRNMSYIPRNHNRGYNQNNNNNMNNKNKNNLNINVNAQNITSPRYGVNSPSNYSNRSASGHRNNNNQNQQNVVSPLPQTQIPQTNSSDSKYGFDMTTPRQTQLTYNNSSNSQQSLKSPPVATNTQYQSFNATAQQLLNNVNNTTSATVTAAAAANYPRYVPLPQPTIPYNIAGASVSNYNIIPSVPNSLIAGSVLNSQSNTNAAINLNTLNMMKNPYSLNMQNLNAAAIPNANVSNNSTSK